MIKNEDAIVNKKERWNEDWPTIFDRYYWHTRGHQKLVEQYIQAGTVLDIGCGAGYLAASCYPDASVYTGIDISEKAISEAKKLFPMATFIVLDIEHESLPFTDNSFDMVVCSETIEHLAGFQFLLSEIQRVAKREIIITVPISMGERDHVWPVWSMEDVEREFGMLGKIIEVRRNYPAHSNLIHIYK